MTKKLCFVIMSFKPDYDELYSIIKKSVEAENYVCKRSDDEPRPGTITAAIIQNIIDADLIIADLSENNPNVYYELGISHSIGNKTITISNDVNVLPFDVKGEFTLKYDISDRGGKRLLEYDLQNYIRTLEERIKNHPDEPQNIVQTAGRDFFMDRKRIHETLDDLLEERKHLNFLRSYINNNRYTDNSGVASALADEVITIYKKKMSPIMIGISGAAGVGKSTFSQQLKDIMLKKGISVSVLPLDAFLLDRSNRLIEAVSGYDPKASDITGAAKCIRGLRDGNSQLIRPYNHNTGKHEEETWVKPAEITIVEGIHSLHPDLHSYYALKIFLYSSPETTSELRFLADIFDRSYSPRDAFSHANTEYSSFEKHILHYINFSNRIVNVKEYWTYEIKGEYIER